MKVQLSNLKSEIYHKEHPTRRALSLRYPLLRSPILFTHILTRTLTNYLFHTIARTKREELYTHVLTRHQSPLVRKLGVNTEELQRQKITNLAMAIQALNMLVIQPGETFSFWGAVGAPTRARGYVDGMLLSNGKVVAGIGGGLCQLSNLLYWMFLHSELTVTERKHHSMDVFPDSGRTLPFGSGATVMYNFIDLQAKNTTAYPIQIRLWLTDSQLAGQLRAPLPSKKKYHVYEKNHCFIHNPLGIYAYYRHNEIWRDVLEYGVQIASERITQNLAPVLYEITPQYLMGHAYHVLDIDSIESQRPDLNR